MNDAVPHPTCAVPVQQIDAHHRLWLLRLDRRRNIAGCLTGATKEAVRSLLMPEIVTGLEGIRHVHQVETTIDALEAGMFELDADPNVEIGVSRSELEDKNRE